MTCLLKREGLRGAIGLIAAYAIALQTLFAALAPVPVNAQGIDHSAWSIICFGSGNTAATDSSDPDAPAPASGKFHCILCGAVAAGAAILPDTALDLALSYGASVVRFAVAPDAEPTRHTIRAGHARAPPLTV